METKMPSAITMKIKSVCLSRLGESGWLDYQYAPKLTFVIDCTS